MKTLILLCLPWPALIVAVAWPWVSGLWSELRYQWLCAADGHHIDDVEHNETRTARIGDVYHMTNCPS